MAVIYFNEQHLIGVTTRNQEPVRITGFRPKYRTWYLRIHSRDCCNPIAHSGVTCIVMKKSQQRYTGRLPAPRWVAVTAAATFLHNTHSQKRRQQGEFQPALTNQSHATMQCNNTTGTRQVGGLRYWEYARESPAVQRENMSSKMEYWYVSVLLFETCSSRFRGITNLDIHLMEIYCRQKCVITDKKHIIAKLNTLQIHRFSQQ